MIVWVLDFVLFEFLFGELVPSAAAAAFVGVGAAVDRPWDSSVVECALQAIDAVAGQDLFDLGAVEPAQPYH